MKIKEILEARYGIQKPNVRDVHQVARKYKQFTNHQISDYDLWAEGKPSINQFGTIAQGFTSLDFTFQNKSSEDALAWVRNFVGSYSLPHTDIKVKGPAGVLIDDDDNEFTRVTITYAEHESFNEAKYIGDKPTTIKVPQVYQMYQEYNSETGQYGQMLRNRANPFIKARQRRDKHGEGFAQIAFLYHGDDNRTTDYLDNRTLQARLERAAKAFMKHHQLPYTKVQSRSARVGEGRIVFSYRVPRPVDSNWF